MDVDREINDIEDQLRSNSLEEIKSCSSSILDSPGHGDAYEDDDDFEDGINVTMLSASAAAKFIKEADSENKVEKELNVPPVVATTDNSDQLDSKGPETQTNNAVQNGQKAKRLNGAGKKRFKYLVAHGYSPDEARVLAEKPFKVPYSDPNKRRRQAELSESNASDTNPPKRFASEGGKPSDVKSSVQMRLERAKNGELGESSNSKEFRYDPLKPSYREILNSIRIGILPDGYPNVELTQEQLIATQKAILTKVTEQRKGTTKPKFGNCLFRSGHLIIICKNQETVDWLKVTIPSIKPWEQACLTAVDEKDIPRPEILIGFFPRSVEDTNEDILAFVEGQNEGLMVDTWKILKRYTVKQNHVELVFTVDDVSMKTLEKCDFTVDYKFGVAYLRKKASMKTGSNEDNHGPNEEQDGEKKEGDTEQSRISSRTRENSEDADMLEINRLSTEASDIANIGFVETRNATANVDGFSFSADEYPPGISGAKNNGNSVLSTSSPKFDSSSNKDDLSDIDHNFNKGTLKCPP